MESLEGGGGVRVGNGESTRERMAGKWQQSGHNRVCWRPLSLPFFFLHANGSTVYICTETPVVEVFVIVLQWCEKRKDMRKRNVAGNVMQAR